MRHRWTSWWTGCCFLLMAPRFGSGAAKGGGPRMGVHSTACNLGSAELQAVLRPPGVSAVVHLVPAARMQCATFTHVAPGACVRPRVRSVRAAAENGAAGTATAVKVGGRGRGRSPWACRSCTARLGVGRPPPGLPPGLPPSQMPARGVDAAAPMFGRLQALAGGREGGAAARRRHYHLRLPITTMGPACPPPRPALAGAQAVPAAARRHAAGRRGGRQGCQREVQEHG